MPQHILLLLLLDEDCRSTTIHDQLTRVML